MREAETLDERLGVLVPRRAVIVLVIAVRADLDPAERHLRPRVHVPEPVRPHENVHVIDQFPFAGSFLSNHGSFDDRLRDLLNAVAELVEAPFRGRRN